MKGLLVFTALLLFACTKPQPVALDASTGPDLSLLNTIAPRDIAGYLSGNYRTTHNHPAMYADLDRKAFVMMGNRGSAELPLSNPSEAIAAFEQFLLFHGYAVNGKKPTDDRPRIVIGGKEMVVVPVNELLPEMPAELKAHFTPQQFDLLYHSDSSVGFKALGMKYPVMYAHSESITVFASGEEREFPAARANEAFADFRKLLPH